MTRRRFSREFKLEAVRLVGKQNMTVAEAARDLGFHYNILRKWVKQYEEDSAHAFPGSEQLKPVQFKV